jgi:hypothetical protein
LIGIEARAEIASDNAAGSGSSVEGEDEVGVGVWLGVGYGVTDSVADGVGVLDA